MECVFCKIVKGEIPSEKVYEDQFVLGFKDIYPKAETHLVFIHKEHTKDIVELIESDSKQIQDLFSAIGKYSRSSGLYDKHFKVISNVGERAGQSVFHTHIHLLSGKRLGRL